MTRDEVREWFLETAKPEIEDNRGLFRTYHYVYEDNDGYGDYDPYSFDIGYQPYSCGVILDDGETCDDCPYRTSHGDCGEYHLYINEDGTIYYEGSDRTYNENEFKELISEFF